MINKLFLIKHKALTGTQKHIKKWIFSKIYLVTGLLCQFKNNTTKNVGEDFLQSWAEAHQLQRGWILSHNEHTVQLPKFVIL